MSALGHIYVVDDDESMRSSLARMLTTYGYTADVYASPEDFLHKSVPVSPAAILLDMRMPVMSGVELQNRLLEMGRLTPIIFISGESMSHEIVMGMKQGAVDFFI